MPSNSRPDGAEPGDGYWIIFDLEAEQPYFPRLFSREDAESFLLLHLDIYPRDHEWSRRLVVQAWDGKPFVRRGRGQPKQWGR